jgi:hypothetical protein
MPIKTTVTIPIEMYTYAELSASAKQEPRNKFIEEWIYDNWADDSFEYYEEAGKEFGFIITNIYYTGFYSQGDGASWIGHIDPNKFLKAFGGESIGFEVWRCVLHFIEARWGLFTASELIIVRPNGSRYSHSNTMNIHATDFHDLIDELIDDTLTIETESILQGMRYSDAFMLLKADTQCIYKNGEDFTKWVLDEAKQYADRVYAGLRSEYDAMCGDEYIGETYDANDIYFDERGELIDRNIVNMYKEQTKEVA